MTNSSEWDIPGATFHVMNRGNRKARVFEDDRDRKRFTRLLIETKNKNGVDVLIGGQMGTHFHLTVTTPHGNLSDFMRDLEGEFARYSNWRHGRVGHVFQERFRRVLIQSDLQLFIVAAYIFNNPVAAGLVKHPADWKWTTYAASVGLAPVPTYLSTSWIETLFPAGSLSSSQALLRRCMDAPQPVIAYLEAADPTSAEAIRTYIDERLRTCAQPCSLRLLMRPPLEKLFLAASGKDDRDALIQIAKDTHGYKLADIAQHLQIHPTTASKIYCSRRRINTDSL